MAMSGYCDSWKVPSGKVTTDGKSYAGAFYRWSWTATHISANETRIDWSLQGRGRTSSPTWLVNECYVTINGGGNSNKQIYALPWDTNQTGTEGVNTSFNHNSDVSQRDTGSFTVKHSGTGTTSVTVTMKVSIYAGRDTGDTTTATIAVDVPTPSAVTEGVVKIYNGSKWVNAIPYVYNGSKWIPAKAHTYNGSKWVVNKE